MLGDAQRATSATRSDLRYSLRPRCLEHFRHGLRHSLGQPAPTISITSPTILSTSCKARASSTTSLGEWFWLHRHELRRQACRHECGEHQLVRVCFGGSATGGQYTLSGIPTGTTWTGTPPPAGEAYNYFFDGTSDGTHNYTVEYRNSNSPNQVDLKANVIATDLNWQNPVVLFSIEGVYLPQKAYAGVTYDPINNSLWFSGVGALDVIAQYSLTGTLLSSFSTGIALPAALRWPSIPPTATLWFNNCCSLLYQYSTSGVRLQSGTPSGLPDARLTRRRVCRTSALSRPRPRHSPTLRHRPRDDGLVCVAQQAAGCVTEVDAYVISRVKGLQLTGPSPVSLKRDCIAVSYR